MKKWIFIVLLAAIISATASAQISWGEVERAIDRASLHQLPRSAGAAQNGRVKIYLNMNIKFENSSEAQPLQTPCAAVRISPHYLLASLACKSQLTHISSLHNNNTAYETPRLTTHKITQADLVSIQVGNQKLTSFIEDVSSQLLLIKIRNQELTQELAQELSDKPVPDLFLVNFNYDIIRKFDQLFINWKFWPLQGISSEVTVEYATVKSPYIRIDSKLGESGDPIFGVSKYAPHHEFLLGFNDTPYAGKEPIPGNQYRLLGADAKFFLQKNLDDFNWRCLLRHLKDEHLFQ